MNTQFYPSYGHSSSLQLSGGYVPHHNTTKASRKLKDYNNLQARRRSHPRNQSGRLCTYSGQCCTAQPLLQDIGGYVDYNPCLTVQRPSANVPDSRSSLSPVPDNLHHHRRHMGCCCGRMTAACRKAWWWFIKIMSLNHIQITSTPHINTVCQLYQRDIYGF